MRQSVRIRSVRFRLFPLLLGAALLAGTTGCRGNPTVGTGVATPCAAPCATPCAPPCDVWSDPVYANPCGGDSGIGRDGTGAFAR